MCPRTDQGSQFTSTEFVGVLECAGVRVLMDGRSRWIDNVMVDRMWRSLKYENVYLYAYETGTEAGKGIGAWIDFYNARRPQSSLERP
jgi:putative transposase